MVNVFWITGLSAAGKTTLAKLLTEKLRSEGRAVIMLDGDDLRKTLDVSTKFKRKERLKIAFQYAKLARMIAMQGVTVVVGAIALFKEIHAWNRKNLPGYFEVYLIVPISELRRRDPKGIYKRYAEGRLHNIAGLDVKIDEPLKPDLVLKYNGKLNPERELQILIEKYNDIYCSTQSIR